MIAAVDTGKLVELAWASIVAGVALATLFALVVVGATRATDLRRERRTAAAGVHVGIAVVAGVACLVAIGLGVAVIVSK